MLSPEKINKVYLLPEETPEISVVMAVYNDDLADLTTSIESILGQNFTDFEFIIINDGSTDINVQKLLDKFADKDRRIRIISQKNKGLTKSLNVGIKETKGYFIARQDADDVSYPERFEKQLAIFEADPEIVLVGGNCEDKYPGGAKDIWGSYDEEDLQRVVFLKAPFPHSTVMMRADKCRELGGYDESFKTAQDTEFWMRFAKSGKLGMVAEPILLRRITPGSISHKRRWRQFYDALRARWKHNRGTGRICAVYYGLRGLIIGFIPYIFIKVFKEKANIR